MKDLLYRLYIEAGAPPVARIAELIALDDLPGLPSKDTVHRIIGLPEVPPSQPDTVTVAGALAKEARWDVDDAMERTRELWVAAQLATPLGDDIEILDPFALGVSRAIALETGDTPLPPLPPFIQRDQDRWLKQFADGALRGKSALVTLIGGSATGKTRSLREFLGRLPSGWRLWHPYDPTRPQAALNHMEQVGPRTVIWLDDAHHYFHDPEGKTAERIAAGIRTLLRDPRRGPVLVLATLWPHIWEQLTAVPESSQEDRYAQQRELLTTIGNHHFVATAFLPNEIDDATNTGDPRLALAVRTALNGEITQLLTGIPDLMARHRAAPPPAAGLIRAAQVYRRLGHDAALPAAMLTETALAMLTYHEAATLTDDWEQEAFSYCTQLCRGVPGLLLRARSGQREGHAEYTLNEYLEESGRFSSSAIPEIFWQAAVRHASAQQQVALCWAAERHGNLAHAVLLAEAAAVELPGLRHHVAELLIKTGDLAGAQRVYAELVEAGDTTALPPLVRFALMRKDRLLAGKLAFAAKRAGHANEMVIMAMEFLENWNDPLSAHFLALIAADGDVRAYCVLGLIADRAGDKATATAYYNKAGRLGLPPTGMLPADIELVTRRGRLFIDAPPVRWEEPPRREPSAGHPGFGS
ncbi:hypothetical protein ACFXPZ_17955 [Streptomyces sp. NPDC059101]|uniref:hypothetical protein n=1 Tax=Streptomyces sp. NPDC059101 TaxID=3346728 RepID=UPI003674C195